MPESGIEEQVPKFWTSAFHLDFFPRRVLANLKQHPDHRKGKVHVLMEVPIAVVACIALMGFGLPQAIDQKSAFGWVLVGLGGAGLVALAVYCVRSTAGLALSYAQFEPWTFLFLALLGPVVALIMANIFAPDRPRSLAIVAALAAGYLGGIGAGLGVQRLGPLRVFVALACGLGALLEAGLLLVYYFR